jgi:hypothetical protein
MNIPDTLDRLLAVYAHVSFTLMKESPKAHGIHFFIRESGDYAAIPTADVPPGYADGYSHPKFEERAAMLLKELVPATEALRDACSVTTNVEQLGIHVTKETGSDQIRLRATVSSSHGYLFCYRDAHFRVDKPIFFSASPAVMCLTLTGEGEGHSNIIKTTAENGMEALFAAVIENKIMVDLKSNPAKWASMAKRWKSAFPTNGKVQLEPIAHLFQCYVVGNRENALAIVSESAPENAAIKDMPDVDVLNFDSLIAELSQTPATPRL